MGRAPCCDRANVKRGPWSPEEDAILKSYVEKHGSGGNWIAMPGKAGLKRCGKSCRLRWLNYLRPDIKHGGFTEEEDDTIFSLYATIGSRWSVIASKLPGRTDNDVKNHWNTKLKKKIFPHKTNHSKTTNNNTIVCFSSSSKDNSSLPFLPSSAIQELETCDHGFSAALLSGSDLVSCLLHPQGLTLDYSQLSSSKFMELMDFGPSGSNSCSRTSPLEVSSLNSASSYLALEQNHPIWSCNGGVNLEDEVLLSFGFQPPDNDLEQSLGLQNSEAGHLPF